jgi:outer membrane receptor protein involved in Fe transport
MSLRNVSATGAPAYDCAGFYGFGNVDGCADPAPRWRHMLRTTWTTPWDFDVSLAWRYVGATRVAASSSNPVLANVYQPADFSLGSRSYFDLSAAWRVNDRLEFRFGINNLFDTDPPFAGSSGNDFLYGVAANGNTYPGVYDSLGRWLFVGVTARN